MRSGLPRDARLTWVRVDKRPLTSFLPLFVAGPDADSGDWVRDRFRLAAVSTVGWGVTGWTELRLFFLYYILQILDEKCFIANERNSRAARSTI